MYCQFSLVYVLSFGSFDCHYLPSDWLERPLALKKPNCGEGIISVKPRPKSAYDCVGLL